MVLHAEPNARSAHRTPLRHRPVRGHPGRQHVGQEVIAGGLAQAIEQYLAPAPPSGQKSGPTKTPRHASGDEPDSTRGTTVGTHLPSALRPPLTILVTAGEVGTRLRPTRAPCAISSAGTVDP